ncbi:uncharacterized protein FSUBG_6156 [Fusarium subglutinans]|uniref:Uncharacterized protein n=1 Tax=Gibberella subglutinans TaxID=42677 RepID=A0A8H5Q2A9_GIBSU|nr:uncharacterized protein FSUBG_6156 [Fusarium subglutinans]KAF5606323.1 hypothetical protein FSUBG_6156 [Fusarium subglutinans]
MIPQRIKAGIDAQERRVDRARQDEGAREHEDRGIRRKDERQQWTRRMPRSTRTTSKARGYADEAVISLPIPPRIVIEETQISDLGFKNHREGLVDHYCDVGVRLVLGVEGFLVDWAGGLTVPGADDPAEVPFF